MELAPPFDIFSAESSAPLFLLGLQDEKGTKSKERIRVIVVSGVARSGQ